MRVADSYPSVILGVSQQSPEDRRPGQFTEQVNMISDPIRGLARRWGSVYMDSTQLPDAFKFTQAALEDTANWKSHDFRIGGHDYVMLHRRAARVAGTNFPFSFVYDKTAGTFIPLNLASGDSGLANLQEYGVSAVTNVGRFVFMASNAQVVNPRIDPTWNAALNKRRAVVWVRTALFDREYKVTITLESGEQIVGVYNTPSQQYPGTLDISDIPITLPDGSLNPSYTAQVTQRQTEYNNQVNQWLVDTAAAVQPQRVADKLREALQLYATQQGIGAVFVREGSHVGCIITMDSVISDISVSDGGDGTSIRGVGNTVQSVDDLSALHYAYKVMRIRPATGSENDVYYVRGIPKTEGIQPFSQITEVVWQECAGEEVTPFNMFVFMTIKGGQAYVASSMEVLAGMLGEDPNDLPQYVTSSCGDTTTNPLPKVFGQVITYLGMFQDRLVVGAGSTLLLSKSGDYLNFFVNSSLTVADDDPIEAYAQGTEDDIIRASVMYDRSMLLFGDAFQYRLNGTQVVTPKNIGFVVAGAHEDAINANPVSSGNFVFFGKWRNGQATVHQIQSGTISDTQAAYELTQALDNYIQGKPVDLLAVTAPNMLFVRTDSQRQTLFVYSYLDSQDGGQRLFDSWSKWTWTPALGYVLGMSQKDGDLTVFTLRLNATESQAWIVADKFILSAELSPRPYLDSLRPATATGGPVRSDDTQYAAAYDSTTSKYLTGSPLPAPSDTSGLWIGATYDTYAKPTNPFMRNSQGKAVLFGRLTVIRYLISLADTAGVTVDISIRDRPPTEVTNYRGTLLGFDDSIVGTQPIGDDTVTALVGAETREHSYTIRAKHWLPLTVSSIQYQGQWFNNAPRV